MENREKEYFMENALKEFSKMKKSDIEQELNKYNIALLNNLTYELISRSNSSYSMDVATSYPFKSSQVLINCRGCNKFLFNGGDLRFREPSYYSVSASFRNEVKQDAKKLYCPNLSCNKSLGQLVEIRKSQPLLMIDIKGIKFSFQKNGSEIFSKWSKVADLFEIKSLI